MSRTIGWRPYVPVAQRRANAARELAKLSKKNGQASSPVLLEAARSPAPFGARPGATTSRPTATMPTACRADAPMSATARWWISRSAGQSDGPGFRIELYKIEIKIKPLAATSGNPSKPNAPGKLIPSSNCSRAGFPRRSCKLSPGLNEDFSRHRKKSNWTAPARIGRTCASTSRRRCMASGARLDQNPELLFLLRGVDPSDLISQASAAEAVRQTTGTEGAPVMSESEMADVFGIELAPPSAKPAPARVNGQHVTSVPMNARDNGMVQAPATKPKTKRKKASSKD